MKPPRYQDVRAFCRIDGWTRAADQPGRRVSKHETWTRPMPGGPPLRTAISKGRGQYGPQMFARMLKHQLRVTEEQFWQAVRSGVPPERPPVKPARPTGHPLPLALAQQLLARGYTEAQLRGLTAKEARLLPNVPPAAQRATQ